MRETNINHLTACKAMEVIRKEQLATRKTGSMVVAAADDALLPPDWVVFIMK